MVNEGNNNKSRLLDAIGDYEKVCRDLKKCQDEYDKLLAEKKEQPTR